MDDNLKHLNSCLDNRFNNEDNAGDFLCPECESKDLDDDVIEVAT